MLPDLACFFRLKNCRDFRVKYPVVLLLCALFFSTSSCAYFNTFHNTKKLYQEAEKEREKRKDDKMTSSEKRKYDETIKKASRILELYPNSKYVDDALFMLGNCMFYKSEFIPAQRKFQELITFFPESNYFYRARVWLARTDIELRDYASARVILNELLRQEKLDHEIHADSRFLLGDILYKQENFKLAEQEYLSSAEVAKNKKTRANAYFRSGQCQLLIGKNQEAVKSFDNAIKHSQDRRAEFEARLHYARALKQGGDYKTAARVCNELAEIQDFKDQLGRVQLEIADIVYFEGKALYNKLQGADLQFKGKIEEALDKYEIVLLQNKRTAVAAAAHYKMGKIKQGDLRDFAGAQESYQKVKLEFIRSEYTEEAVQRAKAIADLIRLNNLVKEAQGEQLMASGKGNVHHLSSLELLLLEHGVDPELRLMRELKRRAAADTSGTEGNPAGDSEEIASLAKREELVANKLQLAEVYLFQFGQIDSALAEYRQLIELFEDHPGAAKALYSSAYIYEHEYHNKFKMDSLLYEIIQRFPNSEQARAAQAKLGLANGIEKEPAEILFERAGNTLFDSQNVASAIEGYRSIVDAYPESEYAPRSLFAIGWLQEQEMHDPSMAVESYREVLQKYPDFLEKATLNRKLAVYESGIAAEEGAAKQQVVSASDSTVIKPREAEPGVVAGPDSEGKVVQPAGQIITRDRRPKVIEMLWRNSGEKLDK